MESTADTTRRIEAILASESRNPASVHAQIIEIALERLHYLTRAMMRSYPALARWEQTDDVFQESVIRLYRSLRKVRPKSARHFFNLATLQVRRTLIDLARHHFGPLADAANHHSRGSFAELEDSSDRAMNGPSTLAQWAEFHEAIENLPEEQREVFSLIWYAGTTQADAARILNVSAKTVQRRFLAARLNLAKNFSDGIA